VQAAEKQQQQSKAAVSKVGVVPDDSLDSQPLQQTNGAAATKEVMGNQQLPSLPAVQPKQQQQQQPSDRQPAASRRWAALLGLAPKAAADSQPWVKQLLLGAAAEGIVVLHKPSPSSNGTAAAAAAGSAPAPASAKGPKARRLAQLLGLSTVSAAAAGADQPALAAAAVAHSKPAEVLADDASQQEQQQEQQQQQEDKEEVLQSGQVAQAAGDGSSVLQDCTSSFAADAEQPPAAQGASSPPAQLAAAAAAQACAPPLQLPADGAGTHQVQLGPVEAPFPVAPTAEAAAAGDGVEALLSPTAAATAAGDEALASPTAAAADNGEGLMSPDEFRHTQDTTSDVADLVFSLLPQASDSGSGEEAGGDGWEADSGSHPSSAAAGLAAAAPAEGSGMYWESQQQQQQEMSMSDSAAAPAGEAVAMEVDGAELQAQQYSTADTAAAGGGMLATNGLLEDAVTMDVDNCGRSGSRDSGCAGQGDDDPPGKGANVHRTGVESSGAVEGGAAGASTSPLVAEAPAPAVAAVVAEGSPLGQPAAAVGDPPSIQQKRQQQMTPVLTEQLRVRMSRGSPHTPQLQFQLGLSSAETAAGQQQQRQVADLLQLTGSYASGDPREGSIGCDTATQLDQSAAPAATAGGQEGSPNTPEALLPVTHSTSQQQQQLSGMGLLQSGGLPGLSSCQRQQQARPMLGSLAQRRAALMMSPSDPAAAAATADTGSARHKHRDGGSSCCKSGDSLDAWLQFQATAGFASSAAAAGLSADRDQSQPDAAAAVADSSQQQQQHRQAERGNGSNSTPLQGLFGSSKSMGRVRAVAQDSPIPRYPLASSSTGKSPGNGDMRMSCAASKGSFVPF
jgi:hypothetical protein